MKIDLLQRHHAFFEKFKRLLNKCYTKEECIKVMEQLHIETEENAKN